MSGSSEQLLAAFEEAGIKLEDTEEDTLSALDDPRARQILGWRAEAKLASNIQTLLNAEHGGGLFDVRGRSGEGQASRKPNFDLWRAKGGIARGGGSRHHRHMPAKPPPKPAKPAPKPKQAAPKKGGKRSKYSCRR